MEERIINTYVNMIHALIGLCVFFLFCLGGVKVNFLKTKTIAVIEAGFNVGTLFDLNDIRLG